MRMCMIASVSCGITVMLQAGEVNHFHKALYMLY
jgi:hypothetical protein